MGPYCDPYCVLSLGAYYGVYTFCISTYHISSQLYLEGF